MPINVISELQPKNAGAFALLDDQYLRGGFHVCANLTERNNITTDRRKSGMHVFAQSTDLVYVLQDDLVTWLVDAGSSNSLQQAYNGGSSIVIANGNPVVMNDGTSNFLTIAQDRTIQFTDTLIGRDFTSSITANVNTNLASIVIDISDKTKYRAIQYYYTITNSDNSGFETGQLYLIHDGNNAILYTVVGATQNTPCGVTFNALLSGYNLQLLVTTDNSGSFSRVFRLFKIALA